MSVVKINVLSVPEGAGAELEKRFAARKHSVDGADGFEGFELLRPTGGESRYFVVTRWRDEASFEAWRSQRQPSHESTGRQPVSSQAELLEFEVVDLEV
ncbi:antibiotic biosynthesis monooxygenase [Kocuria palustris]|uniref:antibiotic biosynthesis monooxygenase family protein n=1 Tax=Kocuria palustris TaxID=71999 RepID=UPI001958D3BA|nr:antibiotic biosynthesis monooxygenase [Kocuria palustris]MBM7823862.1 heme-degrading monooxygenase HmoA [Kocuria palustris]